MRYNVLQDPKKVLKALEIWMHSKTQNTYVRYGLVKSVEKLGRLKTIPFGFIALDAENKSVEVPVIIHNGEFYFERSKNPKLFDNESDKILYERNGVFWLRSLSEWEEPVEVNGKTVDRFVRME